MTQKQIVLNRLKEFGTIDNFWAIGNKVSIRLGAIIHELRKEGYDISGKFGEGVNKKNFYYTLSRACCYSFGKFGVHSQDCKKSKVEELKNQLKF